MLTLLKSKAFIPVLVLTILAFAFIGEAIQRAIDFASLNGYALFGAGIVILTALYMLTGKVTKYTKYFFIGGAVLLLIGLYT